MKLEDIYDQLKNISSRENITITDYKQIDYGIQLALRKKDWKGVLRVYKNKKGEIKYDYSQLKTGPVAQAVIQLIEKNRNKAEYDRYVGYPLIGSDESGKGDYFGPLVCAAIYIDEKNANQLLSMGIKDSKKIPDRTVIKLAQDIQNLCKDQYVIIEISPHKYNHKLVQDMNLNDLLAYAHARAIEPLLQKTDAIKVMVDKFGHENLVSEQLVNQSGNIDLIQVNRSETNVAVASASILARSHYLLKLSEMSTKVGIELSKGVSPKVIKQARQFVEKYGKDKLAYVAKLHFKTTKQLKVPGI